MNMKNDKLIKIAKIQKRQNHTYKINPLMLPIETIEFFLDYFGTIKSRNETEFTIPIQKHFSKVIRRLRYYGFIPFLTEEIIFEEENLDEEHEEQQEECLIWENM